MRTHKGHYKSCLADEDPNSIISEWDRIILQTNITLNILRSSRANPKLSEYSYVHGLCDFTCAPVAFLGTNVLVHSNPDKRNSWDLNEESRWYVGPSLNHYQCV